MIGKNIPKYYENKAGTVADDLSPFRPYPKEEEESSLLGILLFGNICDLFEGVGMVHGQVGKNFTV